MCIYIYSIYIYRVSIKKLIKSSKNILKMEMFPRFFVQFYIILIILIYWFTWTLYLVSSALLHSKYVNSFSHMLCLVKSLLHTLCIHFTVRFYVSSACFIYLITINNNLVLCTKNYKIYNIITKHNNQIILVQIITS